MRRGIAFQAVATVALGSLRHDPPLSQPLAVGNRVIPSVGVQLARTELAATDGRRDAVHELCELGDVVAVGASQRERQRGVPFPLTIR